LNACRGRARTPPEPLCPDNFCSDPVILKLALRLDQNSSDRAHQPIGRACELLKIVKRFVLFRLGKRFVEPLYSFGDPAAKAVVHTGIAQHA
jgi:hypothetical protein